MHKLLPDNLTVFSHHVHVLTAHTPGELIIVVTSMVKRTAACVESQQREVVPTFRQQLDQRVSASAWRLTTPERRR